MLTAVKREAIEPIDIRPTVPTSVKEPNKEREIPEFKTALKKNHAGKSMRIATSHVFGIVREPSLRDFITNKVSASEIRHTATSTLVNEILKDDEGIKKAGKRKTRATMIPKGRRAKNVALLGCDFF